MMNFRSTDPCVCGFSVATIKRSNYGDSHFRKLKTELLDVKRKGAKHGSRKYSQRSCGRCQEPLSRLSLFSSQCKICNHHVCQQCRTVVAEGTWLCNVCAKES